MVKQPDPFANIDLNLLYTFHAFTECQSLKATADRLGRSQPAISARLHQLERDLGAKLLAKHGRRLELTPLGRSVRTQLAELFFGVRAVLDRARAAGDEPTGTLRIGALPTVGVYLLAPRIADFVVKFPGVEVEIKYGLVETNLVGIHDGTLDVVVGIGEPPAHELEVRHLLQVKPALVARSDALVISEGTVPVEALSGLPIFGYGTTGDAFFGQVWDFYEQHGLDKQIAIRVCHIQTLKALVAAGRGMTILPDYTVVEPELTARPVEGLDFQQSAWVASRPSSSAIPLVTEFIECLAAPKLQDC